MKKRIREFLNDVKIRTALGVREVNEDQLKHVVGGAKPGVGI